ncbi:MAG: hypothetical protein IKE22_12385 [Atopobiaceae bacterium]|nr:hypothetical protein [Atopobiaceae bacterium]
MSDATADMSLQESCRVALIHLSVEVDLLTTKTNELEADNDKLRELAHILLHCMQIHAECDDCRLNGAKGELALDPLCACDGLHDLLRELGLEKGE